MKMQIVPAVHTAALLALFFFHVEAAPTSIAAEGFAGSATADLFPPAGSKPTYELAQRHTEFANKRTMYIAAVTSQLFPPESIIGFPGPTPTGVEPAAIQTAKAYPYNDGNANQFPLIKPQPHGSSYESPKFDISKYWGNLSPWYSLRSSDYGLPDASPLVPEGCDITQVHLLYRHGARYPTNGAAPGTFAQKIANATKTEFVVSGELSFLSDWTYKLGAERLTPFGRSQNFLLGVAYRELYGHLLNNFTAAKTLPVFRTQSQDRMVSDIITVNLASDTYADVGPEKYRSKLLKTLQLDSLACLSF